MEGIEEKKNLRMSLLKYISNTKLLINVKLSKVIPIII